MPSWAEEVGCPGVADGTIVEAKINKSNGPFKFKLRVSSEQWGEQIEIYSPSGKRIQTIKWPPNSDKPCSSINLLRFEDLNFDGYSDMLILKGSGQHVSGYEPWIYNPKIKRFEKADLEQDLENPTVDNSNRLVEEESPMGVEVTYNYYRVKGKKFILVKSIESKMVVNKIVTTTKKVIKGKWRIIDIHSRDI
jgi:hypothetical protein